MEPGGAIMRTGLAVLLLGARCWSGGRVEIRRRAALYPARAAGRGEIVPVPRGQLLNHTATTAAEIGLGLDLALVLGLGAALAFHASCTLAGAVLPLLSSPPQAVPVFAVAPCSSCGWVTGLVQGGHGRDHRVFSFNHQHRPGPGSGRPGHDGPAYNHGRFKTPGFSLRCAFPSPCRSSLPD
jgi:hypothetical protein